MCHCRCCPEKGVRADECSWTQKGKRGEPSTGSKSYTNSCYVIFLSFSNIQELTICMLMFQKYRLNLHKLSASMQENFSMQNFNLGGAIGGSGSVTGHNGLFVTTPPITEMQPLLQLDHNSMGEDSHPILFPFHDPNYIL